VVRHKFGTDDTFDRHPLTAELMSRGYVDYLACPLVAMHGPVNVFAVGTKLADGFAEEHIATIKRLQAPLARVVEAQILHQNTISMLSTYVGRDAGEKVLQGHILRGDSERISAVILFADLVGFTELSNTRPSEEAIGVLNRFFDVMDAAIRANGGETLKFIGDGLLAIFPTPDDVTAQAAAAFYALSAIDEARSTIDRVVDGKTGAILFRAALHVGDVHYGNIGSAHRLDFTAVGPAVNLAARILEAGAELGASTLCSDAFADLIQGRTTHLRDMTFKGFPAKTPVHAVS
jgi:adenylate cyclase